MGKLEVGNTDFVKSNMSDLIQINQSIYDLCGNLDENCQKIEGSWRSEGTTDNVNYIKNLRKNIEKIYTLTYIVSDIAEYVNKYIDDSAATSSSTF